MSPQELLTRTSTRPWSRSLQDHLRGNYEIRQGVIEQQDGFPANLRDLCAEMFGIATTGAVQGAQNDKMVARAMSKQAQRAPQRK